MPPRRFPPPWSVEEADACFVRDANGQALAYVYFEDEPGPEPPNDGGARPRRSGTKRGLVGAFLTWIKKR